MCFCYTVISINLLRLIYRAVFVSVYCVCRYLEDPEVLSGMTQRLLLGLSLSSHNEAYWFGVNGWIRIESGFVYVSVCDYVWVSTTSKASCAPWGAHWHHAGVSFEWTHTVNIWVRRQNLTNCKPWTDSCFAKNNSAPSANHSHFSLKLLTSAWVKCYVWFLPVCGTCENLLRVHCLLLWEGHTCTQLSNCSAKKKL